MKKNYIMVVATALLLAVSCNNAPATNGECANSDSTKCCVDTTKEVTTAAEAIEALKEGNKRFVEGKSIHFHSDMPYVKHLNNEQHPYATIVACSDSRVPVELLFDQGFGDVFVIRTAGNSVVDNVTLGSVDYAINHLHSKVIVVLGHSNCGAVTGIVNMGVGHSHEVENDQEVGEMLNNIASYIPQHKGTGKDLDVAIKDNVEVQINEITKRDFVKELIEKGELIVTPAIYDLSNGEVTFEL